MESRQQASSRIRFILLALAGVCLVVLLLGRAVLFSLIRSNLTGYLAREHHLVVSEMEVGGSLVGGLRLAKIRAARIDPSTALAEVAVESLRADYSLIDLFRGMDAFVAGTRITIEGGSLDFDLAGPAEESAPLDLPRVLPQIAWRGISLRLRHGDNQLHLAQGDVSLNPLVAGQGQLLRLESDSVSFGQAGGNNGQALVVLSGWYRPDSLVLQKFVLNGEDVPGSGKFVFARNGAPDSFALDMRVFGGELAASGTLGVESEISLRLAALDPAQIVPLLPPSDYLPTGTISGHAEARFGAEGISAAMDGVWQGTVQGEDIDLSCRATLVRETITLSRVDAAFAGNRLSVTDAVFPLAGLADPMALVAGLSMDHFSARFANLPALLKAAGSPPEAIPLPATHLLVLEGTVGGHRLVLSRGSFTSGKNSMTLERASLELPDAGQSFAGRRVNGAFHFTLTDLAELASLAGLPEMAGSMRGSMVVSGTVQAPEGTLSIRGEQLRVRKCPVGDLRLEAKADGRAIQVNAGQVRQAGDSLRFSGVYSLERQAIETLEGELSIRELGRYGAACTFLGNDLAGRLTGSVRRAADGTHRIALRLLDGQLAALAVDKAELALVTEDWKKFTCDKVEVATPHGGLSLAGLIAVDPARRSVSARLAQASVFRGGARFSAEQPFSVTVEYGDPQSVAVDSLLLRGPMGSLAASGRLSRQEKGDFQLRASGFKSGAWLGDLLPPGYGFSGLEMTLAIRGPVERATGTLVGRAAAFSCPQFAEPFTCDVDLAYSPEGLRVRTFALNSSPGRRLSLTGSIPYAPFAEKRFLSGPLSVQGAIRLPDLPKQAADRSRKENVTGGLGAELDISGTWLNPVGRASIRSSNLVVPQLGDVLPLDPLTLDCALALRGDRLVLERGRFSSASWEGEFSGDWSALPQLPALLTAFPEQLPGTLAIRGSMRMADLGWLAEKSPDLRRVGGRINTSFALRGEAAKPRLSGQIALENGALRFTDPTLPALDGVQARAALAGDTIKIHSLQGLLGGGPFTAAGSVALAGAQSRFDLAVKGRNLLFFRDAELKVRGDADLRLTGPLDALTLSGDLLLTEGSYTKKFDFLGLLRGDARPGGDAGLRIFSLSGPPFADMVLRIKVGTGQPFVVRNSMIMGAVRPDFRLTGTGALPVLIGQLYVDPTRISLPAGRLNIDSGVITFPENDPNRPTFDVTAKSRLAGYDVTMLIQGTAEEPRITLSSLPPLPDSDLLLLVLTGRLPATAQTTGRRPAAGMNMAVYLGKGLLADWFGFTALESDESVLQRFDLEIGRQISSSGEDTLDAQFRLMEGMLLPGDRLFITGERDVYDNYNVGVKIVFRFK